MIVKEGAE